MLVLERTIGESIMIGDDIEIKICDIPRRNRVRLGIDAPGSMQIDRKETKQKTK